MFQVGYRTASLGALSLEEAFVALAQLGYDAVELCLEQHDLDPLGLDAIRGREVQETAVRGGIRLGSISYHGDGTPWPERSRRQLAAVEAAPWFGVSVVVLNTPRAEEGIEKAAIVEHLCEVSRLARGRKVAVALEPEPGLVIADVADAMALLETCGVEALGVNLDVGHAFLTEPDLIEAIGSLEGVILHTHFEDMPRGEHKHLLPGEGDMDLLAVLLALFRARFRGVLTLDLFAPVDDPVEVARQALRRTRDLLREALYYVRTSAQT